MIGILSTSRTPVALGEGQRAASRRTRAETLGDWRLGPSLRRTGELPPMDTRGSRRQGAPQQSWRNPGDDLEMAAQERHRRPTQSDGPICIFGMVPRSAIFQGLIRDEEAVGSNLAARRWLEVHRWFVTSPLCPSRAVAPRGGLHHAADTGCAVLGDCVGGARFRVCWGVSGAWSWLVGFRACARWRLCW